MLYLLQSYPSPDQIGSPANLNETTQAGAHVRIGNQTFRYWLRDDGVQGREVKRLFWRGTQGTTGWPRGPSQPPLFHKGLKDK
jgi:hypothetical protein